MGLVAKLKKVTVTTAGTAVPILGANDAQTNIVNVTIQAVTNNIYVGDSTVLASTSNGIELLSATHDKLQLLPDTKNNIDLATVYLDASASGSVAIVLYFIKV